MWSPATKSDPSVGVRICPTGGVPTDTVSDANGEFVPSDTVSVTG